VIPVLLLTFGIAAALPVLTGLRRKGGFLHFSVLGGLVFLGQLFLQAVGVVRADSAPHDGLAKALLMCTLCALAVHIAWELPSPADPLTRLAYDSAAVFRIGTVFTAVGLAGFLLLARLSGGIAAHFSTSGAYALDWRGYPVAYSFFITYLSPGIFLTLFVAMRERSLVKYVVAALPLAVNLAFILILGRRAVLFDTGILILTALWFALGYTPPRALLLAGAAFGAVAIYVAPYYRPYSQIGADNERLRDLPVSQTMSATVNGIQEEFYNAAWVTEITSRNHAWQYGAGIYNYLVASFVPKLIFSEQFKERLFLTSTRWDFETNDFGWHIAYGANMSGPASSYIQFWFYGCLWFYLLARFMKRLYVRAMLGDLFAQCLYAGCMVHAIQSIGNYMYMILNPVVMFAPVLYLSIEFLTAPSKCRGRAVLLGRWSPNTETP